MAGGSRTRGLYDLGYKEAFVTIDRSHVKWMLAVLLAGALATAIYLASPYPTTGSRKTGLLFGLSAASSMGFAALLLLGKRLARSRLVPLRALQRGHIWLGLLSLPLVLFHGGFRTGGTFTRTDQHRA